MTSYTLTQAYLGLSAHTILFRCVLCDYGCANDDMRRLGEECWSMTQEPDGGYPFKIIPRRLLTENSTAVTAAAKAEHPTDATGE